MVGFLSNAEMASPNFSWMTLYAASLSCTCFGPLVPSSIVVVSLVC
jgi:hypothetical protein